ncbi:MAG TPA: hypothetical protein VNU26_17275 [Mycobacteriales bacterium]|nr:hypothetical protein [Mycobacteriales bacterium]
MSARRTAWLVLPLLVGGALALPVQAAPAPPPRAGSADASLLTARLGGAAVVATTSGRAGSRTPHEALTSVRRHADTAAWLGSVAAAVRAAQPDAPAPVVAAAPEPGLDGGGGEPGPWAGTGAAGDVDGDGLQDVLTLSFEAGTLVLQARRGTDAALLWSRDLADGFGALAFPVGRDLTGDGADDLLYVVTAGTEQLVVEESEAAGSYEYRADLTTSVGVVSGADGTTVWETTRDGDLDERYSWSTDPAGLTWRSEYVLRSTALAVLPLVSDDVTGDGVADVALSSIDLDVDASYAGAGALVAWADDVDERVRSGTSAVLLDGPTGTAVADREVAGQAAISVLLPVGQVVADGRGELLWTTERVGDLDTVCAGALDVQQCTGGEREAAVELELLSGPGLTRHWAVTTPGGLAWPFPLGHDVDGDGAADLGLHVDWPGSRFAVLSGADGGTVWEVVSDDWLYLAGIDDGVAALGRFGSSSGEGLSMDVVVERRDARSGALLSTTRHQVSAPVPDGDDWSGAAVGVLDTAPDADGDGRDELLVGVAVSSEAGGTSQTRSLNVVERLADGHRVRTREGDDLAVVVRAGDLDGDGLQDVREDVLTFRPDEWFGVDAVSTARRVVDGAALWTRSGDLFALPVEAGDQDGVAGEELLEVHEDPQLPLQVRSLRGSDLTVRWSAAARGAPPRDLPSTG